MSIAKNNTPDPMKAFRAIAMILNAREDGTKVRLVSVRKASEDAKKSGIRKKPSGMLGGTGRLHNEFRTMS